MRLFKIKLRDGCYLSGRLSKLDERYLERRFFMPCEYIAVRDEEAGDYGYLATQSSTRFITQKEFNEMEPRGAIEAL